VAATVLRTALVIIGALFGGRGLAEGGGEAATGSEVAGAAKAADEAGTVLVRHYTSDLGRAAISDSGELRAGTYVTRPGEIPAGASPAEVEQILEIEAGRGGHYIDFRVPHSNLRVPEGGPTTSGGGWQPQLVHPTPINPNSFLP
jgi:hypothetical protein